MSILLHAATPAPNCQSTPMIAMFSERDRRMSAAAQARPASILPREINGADVARLVSIFNRGRT